MANHRRKWTMLMVLGCGGACACNVALAVDALPPTTVPQVQVPTETKPADPPKPLDPNQPLSKQLDQNEGVIPPPPSRDTELVQPTPPGFKSNMPVITPPGEPGGNPNVQPK
jgi:hypothetical protein